MSQRASSAVSCSISMTCAARPKVMSWSASPRNRERIRVCSASAVRFIGTQRPSIAIENEVSTSSATAAWVRASVSCTSTSSIVIRGPVGSAARRRTPLSTVRGRSHGSVSPNCHSRVAPERSPAAPAARSSRWPCRPDIRWATSRSSALPSWRIAFGLRRYWPSEPRCRYPLSRSACSSRCNVRASTAACSPSWRESWSRSRKSRRPRPFVGWDCESWSASWSSSARSWRAPVPSPRPRPSPPSNCSEPLQSSPGRSAWRLASIRASCSISAGDPKACCESCMSCSRCSGDIELSIRWAAADRWARVSRSSSMFSGFSGKKSPCLAMKSSKSCWVSVPCWCFSSSSLRSSSISLTAARSSSVAFSIACFMPAKRWSSSSRPSRSLICS